MKGHSTILEVETKTYFPSQEGSSAGSQYTRLDMFRFPQEGETWDSSVRAAVEIDGSQDDYQVLKPTGGASA